MYRKGGRDRHAMARRGRAISLPFLYYCDEAQACRHFASSVLSDGQPCENGVRIHYYWDCHFFLQQGIYQKHWILPPSTLGLPRTRHGSNTNLHTLYFRSLLLILLWCIIKSVIKYTKQNKKIHLTGLLFNEPVWLHLTPVRTSKDTAYVF